MGMFARLRGIAAMAVTGSVLALAAIGTGTATAAPADRAGDPVVLTGADLPTLTGVKPKQIVGFKWTGKWVQVPVQIDERKTVDTVQLYPDGSGKPAYVLGDTGFDLEVYADAKTRAGKDTNPNFDAVDELVFMAGDTGHQAKSGVTAPPGVVAGSARTVAVVDPAGGGAGYLYLFRSKGKLDPGAGKSYVEYNFNLTRLDPGQDMLRYYGYSNSNNPEDSTVSTPNYTLHSTDRWIEDEMRVHAGDATGVNILDREVAQATLTSCNRTQYTFSGNWDRGTDNDEGTYIAVKDGPVRAIRSYMGANSGPYTQREHIYYAEREDSRVDLRVHPMFDLHTWTDFSENAIGMTWRNFKNPDGVTVDGQPDTVVPGTTADFPNGRVAWEQLVGPQGSVATMTSVQSDIEERDFSTYYLDEENPIGKFEKQCGGDDKSIGASGYSIGMETGVTPNTDPSPFWSAGLGFNTMSFNRSRYFGSPETTADEVRSLAGRVAAPLVAADVQFRATPRKPALNLKTKVAGRPVKPGGKLKVRVKVKNRGTAVATGLKLCQKSKPKLRGKKCRSVGKLAAGRSKRVTLTLKVPNNRKLKRTKKVKVTVIARAKGAKATRSNIKARVR